MSSYSCDKLQVFDEAKIKRLFVEEIEHPSYSSTGECRVLETADTRSTSIVYRPGKMGQESGKLRSVKQGVGIKVNGYEKVIEIRTNLANKNGLNYKILDPASQTFKQLQAGSGVQMVDAGESIIINAELKAQDSGGEKSSKLVTSNGKIKRLACGDGILVAETENEVSISASEYTAGSGIVVTQVPGGKKISVAKVLKESTVPTDIPALGLYDRDRGILKRLHFPVSHFDVTNESEYYTVSPKFELSSHVTHPQGLSMLHDKNLKCLVGGTGCRLKERDGAIIIDIIKNNVLEEVHNSLTSKSLILERSDNGKILTMEVPGMEPFANVGNGVSLLSGRSIRTLRGRGCKIAHAGDDVVEVICDVNYKNTVTTLGALITAGQKVKAIVAKDNLVLSSTPDTVTISCPMEFPTQGLPVAKIVDDKVKYMALKGSGGCLIKPCAPDVYEIHTEVVRPSSAPPGSIVMVNAAREIKCIMPGEGIDIVDKGTYVQLSACETIGQHTNTGLALYDKRVKKIRSIKAADSSVHVTMEPTCISIKGTYKLKSCSSEGTQSLLCPHDKEKNIDTLKEITVSPDLEIQDRGTHICISAKTLTSKVAALQTLVEELEGKVEKLMLIENVVNKLTAV